MHAVYMFLGIIIIKFFYCNWHMQDLFMRKVRQFTFEIKNLFGTSKPFSCDVEIRHADQLTVLPIEVM